MSPRTRWLPFLLISVTAIVPLVGTLFLGWNVREVLLLYWAENLVIGIWQIAKLARAPMQSSHRSPIQSCIARGFLIVFFTLHYGGFCAGHGLFIHVLSGPEVSLGELFDPGSAALGPLVFLVLLGNVIGLSLSTLAPAALLAIGTMFVTHGLEYWQTIRTGPSENASKLMVEPYKHIMIVHVAIVLGGMLAMALSNAIPVLVLIILGKLLLDWRTAKVKTKVAAPTCG